MCGIFGKLTKCQFDAEDTAKKALNSLKHRGPDQNGFITFVESSTKIILGMTRLSIVDPNGGKQPMVGQDGNVIVTFNGQIYNYRELSLSLKRKGYKFSTESDCEVILRLYQEYGLSAIEKLDGIFAICILDKSKKELYLARDRYGVKPLLFSNRDGFAFASELKALSTLLNFKMEVDAQSVSSFFSFGYVPHPATIFRDVKQVAAASTMCISFSGEIKFEKTYWTPNRVEKLDYSERELKEKYFGILCDSVEKQTTGSYEIGAFLSGGLDSGAVVASLKLLSENVQTFSLRFDNHVFDESEMAKITADKLGVQHHHLTLSGQDVLNNIEAVTIAQDEPLQATGYQYFFLTKKAREFVRICMAGDGADELFGGYQTYCGPGVLSSYRKLPQQLRQKVFQLFQKNVNIGDRKSNFRLKLLKLLQSGQYNATRGHLAWREHFSPEEKHKYFTLPSGVHIDPWVPLNENNDLFFQDDLLDQIFHYDAYQFLIGASWPLTDRIAMSNSLEVRVPFLSNDMVNFAHSIKSDKKVKGFRAKIIPKKALSGILPDPVILAPKSGFEAPFGMYFKNELRDYIDDLLSDHSSGGLNWFAQNEAINLWNKHKKGETDHTRQLSVIFGFLNWYRFALPKLIT